MHYNMEKIYLLPVLLGLCLSCQETLAESTSLPVSQYRLGPGDTIRIDVFGEKSLSVEGKLTDAGTISYPFLGEVLAKGMTISELGGKIAQQLRGEYLRDPQVSVNILQYRDIYVNGQVAKPGNYPYVPGMTVLKAVAIAGGFTDRASRRRVELIRDEGSKAEESAATDAELRPGDILTVEESFF